MTRKRMLNDAIGRFQPTKNDPASHKSGDAFHIFWWPLERRALALQGQYVDRIDRLRVRVRHVNGLLIQNQKT